MSKDFVVTCPIFPESVSEGDINWIKNIGDEVSVDDVIAEIETDKTSIQVVSSVSGVIKSINVESGGKVLKNSDLCVIQQIEGTPKAQPKPKEVDSKPRTQNETEKSTVEMKKPEIKSVVKDPIISSAPAQSYRTEKRVKMTRMRQTIANRLKSAQNTCAMLTTFNEIDMSAIMDLRVKHQEAFTKSHGVKLGFMSAFISASRKALEAFPAVNAYIEGDDIVYHDYVDISVAVASPKGLVVPVLRDVHNLKFSEIELKIAEFSEKAKDGSLAIEDMEGGTFTISNGGIFGSLMGTPILNPPQSAILGMHSIVKRPVVINDQIAIRPMMYVALTYDHRIIDGREAVLFLRKIKESIEDPTKLLLDI